ncbi:MAG TPA: hypothetical protein VHB73_03880, partial [Alphaproteobacteria bacterium]|nr:hypothetical protein [Alphaproteobacteria bacterium]
MPVKRTTETPFAATPGVCVAGRKKPSVGGVDEVGIRVVPVTAPLEVTAPAFHVPVVIVPSVVMPVEPGEYRTVPPEPKATLELSVPEKD